LLAVPQVFTNKSLPHGALTKGNHITQIQDGRCPEFGFGRPVKRCHTGIVGIGDRDDRIEAC
jgi:hypothetical protein